MDIDTLVVRDRDRVRAAGRLVRDRSGEWFEPNLPVAGPGGSARAVRPAWPGAVRVVGADFGMVSGSFERDDAVEVSAFLIGVWSRGQLMVEQQDPPPPPAPWRRPWVNPPCPPPPQGWPTVISRGDVHLDYDLGDLQETGAAVAVTLFRPGDNQPVLVVAASDVAAVEDRLRPKLGQSLCIVPSRWTTAQLEAVGEYLHRHHEQWSIYQSGPRNAGDGQAHIAAKLVRVMPEIALWAAALPTGILMLEPWLMPIRATPAIGSD